MVLITGIISGIALVFVIVFAYWVFQLATTKVSGSSMKPNLYNGDVLLGDRDFKLNRGDVISFSLEKIKWQEKYFGFLQKHNIYIKRVIGLPNETVDIKNGKVYINGIEIIEKYLPKNTSTLPNKMKFPQKIPAGYIFVLGDNRRNSNDSRDFGFVKIENVVSKFFLKVLPKYETL